ncbi:MAG: exo-beta-N-acetylmuramidase NamZ family protein [Desulfobacca sp.]|uniref:exo-beta-N-acetylmuramidase NamZ family protein n=1 Tax=Desulfobacca sp. TaxID=2067990 RepID=UPI004049990B
MGVITGFARLLADPPREVKAARLGLLCNQATVGLGWRPLWPELVRRFPGQVRALFSPQHGWWGEKQDNMVASADAVDPVTGLPVFSLYGERLRPTAESLDRIDLLLVDLPDVGTRVYTFAATMAFAMQAAAQAGKKVLVLDRPNPIGGLQVEGNMLQPEMASIVGPYPLPMRHGFTLGELARYYNDVGRLGCDLEVVPVQGWDRSQYFDATSLPWVLPSPNLPTLDTAIVYPGQVLLEGTNLSEGRGTTRPFELCGAPFIDPYAVIAALQQRTDLPGLILRPTWFQPTFHKWAGEVCGGWQLHVTDRLAYQPYVTTLTLLQVILELYPDHCQWRPPPYEYVHDRLPFDLLTGDPAIREGLAARVPVPVLAAQWQKGLADFRAVRPQYLLYT